MTPTIYITSVLAAGMAGGVVGYIAAKWDEIKQLRKENLERRRARVEAL